RSSDLAPVTVGAQAAATGTILNDEPVPTIAFTGYSAEGTDNLAFVVLSDIEIGTVIRFTDRNWNGSSFPTSEGVLSWTATSEVAAGTVVSFSAITTAAPTANVGTLAKTGAFDLGTSNENVYAFVGTETVPARFLAAFGNDFLTAGGTLTGTGLTEGVNAISLGTKDPDADIAVYAGPRYGQTDLAAYQAMVNDPANWITQDTSAIDSTDGVAPDVPFSTASFTTDPNVQLVSFAAGSPAVAAAEGDSGTTTLTFTVARSGDTTGAVDFAGSIAAGGTTNAADFGGTLPTAFSGTIADGAASAEVTVTVSGDTGFEADENFTLKLLSATNASAPAYVAPADAVATGTIVNDDAGGVAIAFVGFNTEGAHNLAFAALSDIAAGTVIHFTDKLWNGASFQSGESAWSWTAAGDIAAGTIVTLDGLTDGATATSNLGTIAFTDQPAAYLESYETVYAYVGAPDAPTAFLTAISSVFYHPSYGSLANTGLVSGSTAVTVQTGAAIAAYAGPVSGFPAIADYAAAINNGANWIAQFEDGASHSGDGIPPDFPFDLPALTADPSAQLIQFADGSLAVSKAEGDAGTTVLTFTVARSGGTAGTLDFSGAIVPGSVGDDGPNYNGGTLQDDDFPGGVPTTFSGSFADGASTATVTVTVAGDTTFEANETLTLRLESGSSSTANVAVGGRSTATGTIVNDDARSLDIAFVGYTAEGDDALAFVALTDIAAGTVLHFTNKIWEFGSHFLDDADRSTWTWTATGDIAAGAVVTLDALNGAAPTSNLGTIDRVGTGELTYHGYSDSSAASETDEEVIYAYQGAIDQPTSFVSAFTPFTLPSRPNEAGDGYIDAFGGTGLTAGDAVEASAFGPISVFGGPRAGYASMTALKTAINAGNWQDYQELGTFHAQADGIWPDAPFSTLPFSADPAAQIVGFAAGPIEVKTELNAGATTTYTFTVTRTGGTTGAIEFSGVVLTGAYEDGHHVTKEDFLGASPAFAGTIADGEASGTFTIVVTGDMDPEDDETFTAVLQSIVNTAGVPVGAGNILAQGLILDFDPPPSSIAAGEVVTVGIVIDESDHYVIEAGGKLVVDDTAITWGGNGGTPVLDNYGEVRGENLFDTAVINAGQLTINNHTDAVMVGSFDPGGRIGTGVTVTLNNEGTISVRGRVFDFHDVVKNGGSVIVNNLAGGVIEQIASTGTDFIRPGARTVFNNAGTIIMEPGIADGSDGIDYQDNVGGVVNNLAGGWIEAARHAVTGDHAVTVTNAVGATMIGRNGSAVNIDNSGTESDRVFVTNHGRMEGRSDEQEDSDGDAVDVDGLLTLENYGFIGGMGHEGYHDGEPNVSEGIAVGGGTINNYAGGEIYGYGRGIQVDNSSNSNALGATTIVNAGLIHGDGNRPEGVDPADLVPFDLRGNEAINLVGTYADSLTNTGEIAGGVK
ncbi:MAG: beta strand repeat-containing protein, partial [Alphaproteobacteria bacterium]